MEYIIVPLGLAMPMGCVVTRLLTTWAVTVQEWAVLPLLAMATESGGLIAGMGTYYGSSRETKSRIVVVRNVRLTRSCF